MNQSEMQQLRRSIVLAIPLAFAAGLLVMGVALWWLFPVTPTAGEPVAAESAAVAGAADGVRAALPIALQNELDYLREEQDADRRRIASLEASLRALAATGGRQSEQPGGSTTDAGAGLAAADGDAGAIPLTSPAADRDATGEAGQGRFAAASRSAYDRLVAAGVDTQTASNLQNRIDQQDLARLELIDQASREGWRDSEEFDRQLATLEADQVDLRSELGDEGFDRYLYESGGSNRVGVGSVITGSAADQAGLQPGDRVISYADQRVFSLRELQQATRAGQRGEVVQVTVQRDGSEVVVSVPRGPLGITLQPERVEP